ncbi:response regulator transcription factor [Candidatus Gottesmanbacteria bacterium]|nr:response regulator transcription factor [Candidatus Gottesmanbacteria bacterium]
MRILVVEDEHTIASSIKKGLEQEAYAVDVAFTGIEGKDLALTEEYDCIILDLMLPGLDGLEIIRELREKQIHTPVLILTAKGQIDDRVSGLDSGADDYLLKPFAFEELLARIRALLRRPKKPLDAVLRISNIELDTRTFEVKVQGKAVALSHKEFSLLEFLLRHHDVIVTKEQIMNHVWNYESTILPNTVEVVIKNLRKKIDVPGKEHILTVRGFGYKHV